MGKIRIGVMGCASIAQRLVIPAIVKLPHEFDLVAIASRSFEKAEQLANQYNVSAIQGYDNLLERADIDAIYMPLPTGLHLEWIKKTIIAGKHILVEKSFAQNYNVANELISLAKLKHLVLMENFMFKYHHQHKLVFDKLKNNDLGTIRLFRSQFGFPPLDKSNFRYRKELGGGSLLDAGAYTVMASTFILGKEQEVVAATLYIDASKEVDIGGNAILRNKDGIVSQLSFGFDNYYQCNYEMWGAKGKIFVEKAFTPKPDEKTYISIETPEEKARCEISPDNHFMNALDIFYKSIKADDCDAHYRDILGQSKLLSDIESKATRIQL